VYVPAVLDFLTVMSCCQQTGQSLLLLLLQLLLLLLQLLLLRMYRDCACLAMPVEVYPNPKMNSDWLAILNGLNSVHRVQLDLRCKRRHGRGVQR
jgi:hypothetical protein